MTVNIFLGLIGNLTATTLVRRMGARRLSYLSFLLLTLGVGSSAIARSMTVLIAAQAAIGLAMGVGYPVLMGLSIRNVVETERSTAMGWHQSVYAAGMFLGPWISGIMAVALGADVMGIRITFALTAVAVFILGMGGTRLLVEQLKN